MDTNELRSPADDRAAEADRSASASRRAFLRRLGVGGALAGAGVPLLATAAAAQTSTTTTALGATTSAAPTATTVPATTTTAPPRRPSPEDTNTYAFAQSLEGAIAEVYQSAIDSGRLSDEVQSNAAAFRQHHREAAQAYAGLIGRSVTPNAGFSQEYRAKVDQATSEDGVLQVLFECEQIAAASYTKALGTVLDTTGAQLLASIQPIVSQQSVVIGQAIKANPPQYLPTFQTTSDAVGPDQYPL